MSELEITEYRDYEAFAHEWEADDVETQQTWQLLGQLDEDELLVHLPEWLAEKKVGFVDGAVPTEFVGRVDRETEKAIRFGDAAGAPPLITLAHRIHKLEAGLETAAGDDARLEWLEDRLVEKRHAFEQREGAVELSDEWIPKSQIRRAVRRVN